MKTLIVYSSQSGNTRKLANTLYNELPGEKDLVTVEEAGTADGYDLVAVGFWLMKGMPDAKSKEFMATLGPDHKVFLFATHGAAKESEHARNGMARARELVNGAAIAGTFNCPGQVSDKMMEKAGSKPQPPVWFKDAPAAAGHPDTADIEALKKAVQDL